MRTLLEGENIKLTAIKEYDIPIIEDWFNNVRFLRYYDMLPAVPKSQKQVVDMLKSYEDSQIRYIYAIRTNDNSRIIGVAGFDEIIWSNGVATIFIGIGNNKFTGKGFGKEAMRLLLDFGFNELNFYRIQLNVISYNEHAIKLYESLGFIREGIYRDFIYRDCKRYDMYLYGLLRQEWGSK
ncbi:MAG TPA: GNAT family protein [Clostridiales bacterium]|nr:GNAT family protein [Clostridiales bacterium]